MTDQLALPFVSIVGAPVAAPPESYPEVRRPRRSGARRKLPPVASRAAELPPQAADDEDMRIDVHDYLIRNAETDFIFTMRDDSMAEAGIFSGDMLVVDRTLPPAHGHLVLAFLNGERLVRRLHHRGRKTALQGASPDTAEIELEHGSELTIWGVVVGKFMRFVA